MQVNYKMEKWSCRNPLTIEDRKIIEEGIKNQLSSREIAKEINRVKSVVLRESKRLGERSRYDATLAQEHFENRQREGWEKCRQTKINKCKAALHDRNISHTV